MSIQSDNVKRVIFAGNQFSQPFSHSPGWLEELIEHGHIFKESGGSFMVAGYGSVDTSSGWFYIPSGDFVNEPFRSGDIIELVERDESSHKHIFTVTRIS